MQINVKAAPSTGPVMANTRPGDVFKDPVSGRWFICAYYCSSRYCVDLLSGALYPSSDWRKDAVLHVATSVELNVEV